MEDLDSRIRRLSEMDCIPLIRELRRIDAGVHSVASGSGSRASRGSVARNRAEDARDETARLGAIIHFLWFRFPVPDRDRALCEMLAQKLQAKGQWTGDADIR